VIDSRGTTNEWRNQGCIAFTGDLGRPNMPILRDPEIPERVDFLITESTYGDRRHAPIAQSQDALAKVVSRTAARGGKLVIPSFALERAQEIIFALGRLRHRSARAPERCAGSFWCTASRRLRPRLPSNSRRAAFST
jgi:Cft2 family RNA processing exonuclease